MRSRGVTTITITTAITDSCNDIKNKGRKTILAATAKAAAATTTAR